jgi:hypothetical protein
MGELTIRFLVGGVLVSLFALIGDVFRPKSFGGLFGAAPSVALATLSLTVAKEGSGYAAAEARSMAAGAIAFFAYASLVCYLQLRHRKKAFQVTVLAFPVWVLFAFTAWALCLR